MTAIQFTHSMNEQVATSSSKELAATHSGKKARLRIQARNGWPPTLIRTIGVYRTVKDQAATLSCKKNSLLPTRARKQANTRAGNFLRQGTGGYFLRQGTGGYFLRQGTGSYFLRARNNRIGGYFLRQGKYVG
jgi:hypothetical protein